MLENTCGVRAGKPPRADARAQQPELVELWYVGHRPQNHLLLHGFSGSVVAFSGQGPELVELVELVELFRPCGPVELVELRP